MCGNSISDQHFHNGVMMLKRFLHCWPFVIGIPQSRMDSFRIGSAMWSLIFNSFSVSTQVVYQTTKLSGICDAMKLIWRPECVSNGDTAVLHLALNMSNIEWSKTLLQKTFFYDQYSYKNRIVISWHLSFQYSIVANVSECSSVKIAQ